MILTKDRPKTEVSLKIFTDVIEDLKRVAPERGLENWKSLVLAYIGEGLREDLHRLWEKEQKENGLTG